MELEVWARSFMLLQAVFTPCSRDGTRSMGSGVYVPSGCILSIRWGVNINKATQLGSLIL
ncbi:MAG: hypothetical protein WCQ82_04955 [Bacteroidaceae bacterium]|nr:hypothetical protein [Bacteroidaceae bacterium]